MHLDDSNLTDAPLTEMLAACNGVLQEMGRGDIYERHNTGSSTRVNVTNFFKDLAKLSLESQQMCFNSIVGFLKVRGIGVEHVADRLLKGERDYLRELTLKNAYKQDCFYILAWSVQLTSYLHVIHFAFGQCIRRQQLWKDYFHNAI